MQVVRMAAQRQASAARGTTRTVGSALAGGTGTRRKIAPIPRVGCMPCWAAWLRWSLRARLHLCRGKSHMDNKGRSTQFNIVVCVKCLFDHLDMLRKERNQVIIRDIAGRNEEELIRLSFQDE